MRKWIERMIYRKWFYAFLALVLWADTLTDMNEFMESHSPWELVSLVLSLTAALLVTLIFVDLQRRWPQERTK